MTPYDVLLQDLGVRLSALPRRWIVAIFLACSTALRPALLAWAARNEVGVEALAERAEAAARRFALEGESVPDGDRLLEALEQATPTGDAPEETSSTAAQDCWICLDTAVRGAVDPSFALGPIIEYALEPKFQAVSEVLFGVSAPGSGETEEAAIQRLLDEPIFREALSFFEDAIGAVQSEAPRADDLDRLTRGAQALA